MKHIQKLHLLLTTLMAGGFPNRSLVENKKLMADLKEFQGIIYDNKQLYGDPNYHKVPLEKDLEQVENRLAEIIYEQLLAIDIGQIDISKLLELHKDYEVCCHHRKINDDGKIWQLQSEVRFQMLLKAQGLENREQKISTFCFVINNSNGGHKEFAKAKELLKEVDPAGCNY